MANIAVIGGGPAGLLAAACAAQSGHKTVLFERNEKLGKKLYLTGKGRCNVTNVAEGERFFENIARNPKFLFSALRGFSCADIMGILEEQRVPLKIERGGRVFPCSDKSSDIINALGRYLNKFGVEVRLNQKVLDLKKSSEGGFEVSTGSGARTFDAVVLATGGLSYPSTGSDGFGLKLAASLGHTIQPPRAALVPLETVEDWPKQLTGLSLKNVSLSVLRKGRAIYDELGEMLFTHFGVSGPLVLSASSMIADAPEGARLSIDMKPGLTPEQLDRRLVRDFDAEPNRHLANAMKELLPSRMIPVVLSHVRIEPNKPVNQVAREERQRLAQCLKDIPLTVKGALPIEEAIITRGGINVKEIDPSTMESKLVPGLYFAGEIIDVDALTGGFNLQIAFSTGALAGRSIP
ncbi:MAG: NAD(P)/FAD-dependent oxidoreductase [Bacillota bacterium]